MSETPRSTQHAEGSGIAQAQGPGAIANVITNIFRGSTAEQRALRNRQAMLQLVRNTWIKGVLEQSLHGAAMIELGLEERADAVERPWGPVLQMPDQATLPIPRGTRIISVFNAMNRALLILGEPGSGKTTMLLELARGAIVRAEQDPMQPIPVVFNLSSWAGKRQSIAEWLVEELNTKYHIPRKIARLWVENDDLLLLLDGLDEVRAELRDDCVQAINSFRQEHFAALVVCSRIADYQAIATQLKLQGAVLLQPLTPQQVDVYLDGAGIEIAAVRRTLQYDSILQELAKTPLMLSIMTLAYRGMSVEELQVLDTPKARRKHLFDAYVQRMFERRGADQIYSPEQTARWLAWLARKLSQRVETIFLIERMQPSWLSTCLERQLYRTAVGLIAILIGGSLLTCWMWGLSNNLGIGLIVGLPFGLFLPFTFRGNIVLKERIGWSHRVWLSGWQPYRQGTHIFQVILYTVLFPTIVFWITMAWVGHEPVLKLMSSMPGTILLGTLGLMLCSLVILGFHAGSIGEVDKKTSPNQGIWVSARNALLVGLVGGVIAGLVSYVGAGLAQDKWNIGILFGGFCGGLFVGLYSNGDCCIEHLGLRLVLYCRGHFPWNLARFLDYATERIFLHKVGGGYIFVHRLLQEYFASLAETPTTKDTQ